MNQYGSFSYSDYDVMDRSCNTFTYELSKRLHLSEKYPVGILNQSKMGELLAPVVHAIDILGQDHLLSSWSSGAPANSMTKISHCCKFSTSAQKCVLPVSFPVDLLLPYY